MKTWYEVNYYLPIPEKLSTGPLRLLSLQLAALFLAGPFLLAAAQQPARDYQKSVSKTPAPQTSSAKSANSVGAANDIEQLLASGQTSHNQGRFEEAIRIYNRVIALSANQPRTAAIANFRIGNAYMAQGKFGNAEVAFSRAVELNPSDAESYNNLGEALGELKQYPRALEAF